MPEWGCCRMSPDMQDHQSHDGRQCLDKKDFPAGCNGAIYPGNHYTAQEKQENMELKVRF